MAKLFQVTLPNGISSVKLDSQGRATVQYTVKNVSARPIDGRAVLISLPQIKPPGGPAEKGWVKIDGKTDRHFEVDKEETFTVKIAVPPKSPAGNYTFRLDTVWVDQPDQGDPGGAVAFTVAPAAAGSGFPLWVIPVVLVVLIAVGVGVWLALRGGGSKVPDLVGKTVTDADADLKAAGYALDPNVQTSSDSKPEDSGKIVSQNPEAGQKAPKGQTVQVTLGAEMVAVPLLIGHPYQEVVGILNDKHLTPGQTKTVANPNFAGGVVVNQTPAAQQMVKSGTGIDVDVTPQTIAVPNVVGQTLGNAILALKDLTVTSFSGDSTKTVTSQNPVAGAAVPIGTAVTLAFPPPVGGCVGRLCIYQGVVARQMVYEHLMVSRGLTKGNQ